MTEAEKLLQETKSAVVAETQTEDICVIDSDMRIIDIPEQFKVLGVESDKDVKVMQFRIPKTYKGTDLSAFTISVNYQNARGMKGRYIVTDKKVSGDQIEFSWTVGKTATVYRGDTRFIVCMRLTGSDGVIKKEFNTTLATMTVLEGLEVDDPVIEQEEKDIIAQLLQIVDDKSKEAVQAVTEEGTKQIKAVQAAAQEIAADREQIKTNKADIADLMQTKAGAIINSARGERIAVGDSSDAFFEGLKLYGRSKQVTTKGYQLFDASKIQTKSIGGATVTNNGDGSFTISGSGNLTSGFDSFYQLTDREEIKRMFKVGKIYLKNNGVTFPYFHAYFQSTDGSRALTITDGKEHDLTEDILNNAAIVGFSVYANSGATITPGTIRPMLYQSGDGTWEPYTGGKPSPSMEYKQDPESSGDSGTIGIGVCSANLYSEGNVSIGDVKYTDFISWTGKSEAFVSFYAKTNSVDGSLNIAIDYYDANKAKLGGNGWSYQCGNTFEKYSVSFTGEGAAGTGKNVDLRVVRFFKARFRIGNSTTTHIDYKDIVISDSEGVEFTGYQPPQILSLSTPNGLPGLPVDSGGNYTDSNGQQWICDEMDFKRGKYVQRIEKLVLNGNKEWALQSINGYGIANFTTAISKSRGSGNVFVLSSHFREQKTVIAETKDGDGIFLTTINLFLRFKKEQISTVTDLKAWLKENPVTVIYDLAYPIETDIPEETMTAYRNLYTNYPSTVIQNDSGAGMEVEYVADTKQFILDQIKALAQA